MNVCDMEKIPVVPGARDFETETRSHKALADRIACTLLNASLVKSLVYEHWRLAMTSAAARVSLLGQDQVDVELLCKMLVCKFISSVTMVNTKKMVAISTLLPSR